MSSLDKTISQLRPYLSIPLDEDIPDDVKDTLVELYKQKRDLFSIISRYGNEIKEVCFQPSSDQNELEDEESVKVGLVKSLGVLVYLCHHCLSTGCVVCAKIKCLLGPFFVAQIYTDSFKLTTLSPIIHLLLLPEKESAKKALAILSSLLTKMPKIPESFYDDVLRSYPLHKSLCQVIRFSPEESNRTMALTLLRLLIRKFEGKGSQRLIGILISSPDQIPGIVELALSEYRNFLTQGNPDFNSREGISEILKKATNFCCLGSHTNPNPVDHLMERSDAILGLLNFLRFLSLRKEGGEETFNSWNVRRDMEMNFLIPLKEAINEARSILYEELKREENEDTSTRQVKLANVKKMNIRIGNEDNEISDVPDDYAEQGIRNQVIRLDLMDSLRKRLLDILDVID